MTAREKLQAKMKNKKTDSIHTNNGTHNKNKFDFLKLSIDAKTKSVDIKLRFLPSIPTDEQEAKGFDTVTSTSILFHGHNVTKNGEKRFVIPYVCPKTLGKECECCDDGWKKYNVAKRNNESDEVLKGIIKSSISYENKVANVLVVEDTLNPDNEGKVFLFKYGKQISDVLNRAESDDGEPLDVFDIFNSPIVNIKRTQNPKDFSTSVSGKTIDFSGEYQELVDNNKIKNLTDKKEFLAPYLNTPSELKAYKEYIAFERDTYYPTREEREELDNVNSVPTDKREEKSTQVHETKKDIAKDIAKDEKVYDDIDIDDIDIDDIEI